MHGATGAALSANADFCMRLGESNIGYFLGAIGNKIAERVRSAAITG